MKTPIPAAWLILIAAHSFAAPAAHNYPGDFHTALEIGSDLYTDLDPKFRKQLHPQPVCLGPLNSLPIVLLSGDTGNAISGQVSISAGFIDLLNHVAHAKAIDRIQPGFFRQYVLSLDNASAFSSPAIDEPRFWTDAVMNDQASYFNQMIGTLTAINLSHIYLGHASKYSDRMAAAKPTPINDLLTSGEWEASVNAGINNAFDCALLTDGIKALFEAIDLMPNRPTWAAFIVPNHADLKNLNKEMTERESRFIPGFPKNQSNHDHPAARRLNRKTPAENLARNSP